VIKFCALSINKIFGPALAGVIAKTFTDAYLPAESLPM
jgi:hypothetical protein